MNISSMLEAFQWRIRPIVISDSIHLSKYELDDLLFITSFDWNEITGELWEKYFDVISWFSPDAFCYYLPSIIKVSIEESQPNLIVVESIVYMLDRNPEPEWWDEFFLKRWTLFTIQECKAIQEWIFWLSSFNKSNHDDDSLERALETIELLISRKQYCRTG